MHLSPRLPTIKQLQCFVAVAQELNFRRAAQRLNMSQPPLSRQIHALETLLRTRLIDRDTHRVALTGAGQAFLVEAECLLNQLEAAVATRLAHQEDAERDIRIGLTSVLDFSQFPALHETLTQARSHHQARLEHNYTKHLIERLAASQIDLAIVGEFERLPAGLGITHIATDPLVVALPAQHPAAMHEVIDLADIADTSLYWFPRPDNPAFFDRCEAVFSAADYHPPRLTEPADHITLLARIANGEGLALLPASMLAASRVGVVYRELAPTLQRRLAIDIHLVWRVDEQRQQARQLIEALSCRVEHGRYRVT
ncbi:LysR family transcriptional regulator [Halomonas salinarum]|uniref:LysR family transcriptional regulator n=1 Tax=Halomonas salinarum TaxID=1158993 RepID=UPI00143C3C40|nr:LysR family transcriptional regulator [Halomonas salinarum]